MRKRVLSFFVLAFLSHLVGPSFDALYVGAGSIVTLMLGHYFPWHWAGGGLSGKLLLVVEGILSAFSWFPNIYPPGVFGTGFSRGDELVRQ